MTADDFACVPSKRIMRMFSAALSVAGYSDKMRRSISGQMDVAAMSRSLALLTFSGWNTARRELPPILKVSASSAAELELRLEVMSGGGK